MTYDVVNRARRTTRRRVTAACVTAAAALGAVAVAVVAGADPSRPITSPAGPGAPARPNAGAATAGSADLPSDLAWAKVAGVSVPVSTQSGPRLTSGGQARGFAHDRAGGVLAAVHIVLRVNPQVGPTVFDPTLRTQVVGADAAAMRVQVAQAYDELRGPAGVAYGQPIGRLYATLRGYRILSYIGDEVTLRLLTEAPDASGAPVAVSTELRLRWIGADWALVAPAGGTFDHVVTAASPAEVATFLPFIAGG